MPANVPSVRFIKRSGDMENKQVGWGFHTEYKIAHWASLMKGQVFTLCNQIYPADRVKFPSKNNIRCKRCLKEMFRYHRRND